MTKIKSNSNQILTSNALSIACELYCVARLHGNQQLLTKVFSINRASIALCQPQKISSVKIFHSSPSYYFVSLCLFENEELFEYESKHHCMSLPLHFQSCLQAALLHVSTTGGKPKLPLLLLLMCWTMVLKVMNMQMTQR